MGMIGGSFLVAPMPAMALHPGLVTSVIRTSAGILAFYLIILILSSAPLEALSCTAPYSVVLVVFISTGGGSEIRHGVVVYRFVMI